MAGVFNITTPQFTGYVAATVGNSALRPFTALTGARMGFLTVEGGPLRVSFTQNVTAHSSSGHLLASTDKMIIQGGDIFAAITVISPDATGTAMMSIGWQ